MKVLTVYAHPDPKSFCHAVLEQFTAGLHEAGHGVQVVGDWGLRYPGVKHVEHVYFYGAAIADPPQIQRYLRDARQLGRDFAVPAPAPAVASTEGA